MTQAETYVERVSSRYNSRTRPPPGTKIEREGAKFFYTFPDGSRALVTRDQHGPTDAQII